ncbi:hypothetical protein AALP_AA6G103200 [Arabis alpina]|uniref:Uncharacterized protein n=1 Tax=Arabis alpina TaxID=50452 RepID=A0A087GNB5_ARAAL|nr:hypothetical protein AALP_AA6G103200 [Arabis alpina]
MSYLLPITLHDSEIIKPKFFFHVPPFNISTNLVAATTTANLITISTKNRSDSRREGKSRELMVSI